ncbi:MAG: hypothetical protein ROO76_14000 [Terriglobia bacterium]|nr:hypothetical protein [Terriglobia bacterium]
MADPLRKPLEPSCEVEPPGTLPGTSPLADELEARRMKREQERPLVNAAESVGSTVGSAIGAIRNTVHSGIKLVKKHSSDTSSSFEDLSDSVRDRADEVTRQTRLRAQQWTSAAQRRVRTVRTRVHEFSEQRPAQFVLAIGGIAMIAGLILRLWRSNRD